MCSYEYIFFNESTPSSRVSKEKHWNALLVSWNRRPHIKSITARLAILIFRARGIARRRETIFIQSFPFILRTKSAIPCQLPQTMKNCLGSRFPFFSLALLSLPFSIGGSLQCIYIECTFFVSFLFVFLPSIFERLRFLLEKENAQQESFLKFIFYWKLIDYEQWNAAGCSFWSWYAPNDSFGIRQEQY